MRLYECPRCHEHCIPFKDKLRTGHWAEIHCPNCNKRLCAFPWVLAVVYAIYVWDVVWFSHMYYYTHNVLHFLYMILVYLMIEALSVSYLPLARMKDLPAKK